MKGAHFAVPTGTQLGPYIANFPPTTEDLSKTGEHKTRSHLVKIQVLNIVRQ